MIVCHCRAVGHKAVEQAIDLGACDADEVAQRCGAGSMCGGCRPTVEAFLAARGARPQHVDLRSELAPLG
jgi:bacterioferritin-associated ferredoxin